MLSVVLPVSSCYRGLRVTGVVVLRALSSWNSSIVYAGAFSAACLPADLRWSFFVLQTAAYSVHVFFFSFSPCSLPGSVRLLIQSLRVVSSLKVASLPPPTERDGAREGTC